MRPFYLIQRATIRPEVVKEFLAIPSEDRFSRFNRPLTGRSGVIDLDYMGSAEYEWGAIPASYARLMSRYNDYKIHKSTITTKANDVPLWVFCPIGKFSEVESALLRFLNDDNDIRLKEYIRFRKVITADPGDNCKYCENFWWDIENDFMFWIGGNDYAGAVMQALSNDYHSWWATLPEEDVSKRLEDATHGFHGHFWRWWEEK